MEEAGVSSIPLISWPLSILQHFEVFITYIGSFVSDFIYDVK